MVEVLLTSHFSEAQRHPITLDYRRPTQSERKTSCPLFTHECSQWSQKRSTSLFFIAYCGSPWLRVCFLGSPSIRGAETLIEHLVTLFPVFSQTKVSLSFFYKKKYLKNNGSLLTYGCVVSRQHNSLVRSRSSDRKSVDSFPRVREVNEKLG